MLFGNCKELILDLNSISLFLQAFNMLIIYDQKDIPLNSFGWGTLVDLFFLMPHKIRIQDDEYFLFSLIIDLVVVIRTYNRNDVVLQL